MKLICGADGFEDLRKELRIQLGLLQFLHNLPARANRDSFAG
jgi:hypothetical protein